MTFTSKAYDQYRCSFLNFKNKTMVSPPRALSKTQKRNMRKRKRSNAAGKKLMEMKKKKRKSEDIVRHLQQIKDNGSVIDESDYHYVDNDIKRLIDSVFGGATQQSTTVGLLADGAGNEEVATEEDAAAERKEVEEEGKVAEPDERLATKESVGGDVMLEVAEPDERLATEESVGADVVLEVAEPDERLATENDEVATEEKIAAEGQDEFDEVTEPEEEFHGGEEEEKDDPEDTVEVEPAAQVPHVEESDVLDHPRMGLIELPNAELDFEEARATPEDLSSDDSPDWGFLENTFFAPLQLAPHEEVKSHGIRNLWDIGICCNQFTIDERIVRLFSTVEKLLSRSSYTGHARPVRYAPFRYVIEPFTKTNVWSRWTDIEKKGFENLHTHFENLIKVKYGFVDYYMKYSFLYTDLSNYSAGHFQQPHLDMSMDDYGDSNVVLGFMPLTHKGMFLEVWPPGKLEGELVFIKYGTIFFLDKNVVHAGGFSPGGDEAFRMQFCFSDKVLDIEHFQVKSGEEYVHNESQIYNDDEVRRDFMREIED